MANDSAVHNAKKLQRVRRNHIFYGFLVSFIHMFFCVACYYLDLLVISSSTLAIFFILVWMGSLTFLGLILSGYNRSIARQVNLKMSEKIAEKIRTGNKKIKIEEAGGFSLKKILDIDASLFFPFCLWLCFSFIISLYFIKDIRLCVMMLFLAMMVMGSTRLKKNQYTALAVLGILGYGVNVLSMVRFYPELFLVKGEIIQEFIQWCCASVMLVLFSWFGMEIVKLQQKIAKKNTELDDVGQAHKKANLDLHKALKQIQSMARCDHLTGLYNRHYANEKLMEQRALADRGAYGFVICYLDLDHFKLVNDTFGHNIGDEVLKAYARICRSQVRNIDICARFGGEEFVIILVNSEIREAKEVAERIRENIQNYDFQSIAKGLVVTVSIGLTQYSSPEPIEETLTRSDAALYQAKRTGRNRVITFDPPVSSKSRKSSKR